MINRSVSRRGILILTFMVLILLLSVTNNSGQADPELPAPQINQESLDAMRENMHLGILPDFSPEVSLTYSPGQFTTGSPSSGEWGNLLILSFISIDPDNTEIFMENGNGTNPVQLTDTPAMELSVRLSPDKTKILFTSKRDGDYEIYIMDIDGSDVFQVTSNNFIDSRPYWSPDGTQIVYAANERSYFEIYRIDVDGTDKIRLSNYTSSFNSYEPAWAPDGSMIVYVLSDTGPLGLRNRLYRMNPNGTNHQILAEWYECSYYGDLIWSEDSRYLTYDYIPYGTNFTLVSVYNKDMSDPITGSIPQLPGHITEQWNAGLSPTGNEILYTLAHYEIIGEYYVLTELAPMIYCIPGRECRRESIQPTLPWSFDPKMIQYDYLAPTTTMAPLPAYTHDRFFINWGAVDEGIAGVFGYELEYKNLAAPGWNPIPLENPAMTDLLIAGEVGETLEFRARAYDHAGMLENWPVTPAWMARTNLFRWLIRGTILDNRDNPVEDPVISLSPSPMNTNPFTSPSDYTAYLSGLGAHILGLSATGYAPPPDMTLDLRRDLRKDYYLTGTDELVTNGSFEAGSLDGWTTGGDSIPVANSDEYFTGAFSSLLGSDCGNLCLTTKDSLVTTYDIAYADSFVDSEGNHQILAGGRYFSNRYTDYAVRTPDGSWTRINNILAVTSENDFQHIFTDDAGNLYVMVATYQTTTHSRSISLRIKPNGSGWLPQENLLEPFKIYLDALVDGDGNLHSLYYTVDDGGAIYRYYYEYRSPDGIWHDKQLLDEKTSIDYFFGVINLAHDEEIQLLWYGSQYFFQTRDAVGEWGPRETLKASIEFYSKYFQPSIIEDVEHDMLYIFQPSNDTAYYMVKYGDGLFSDPVFFPAGATTLFPIIDQSNAIHIVVSGGYRQLKPETNISGGNTLPTGILWWGFNNDNIVSGLRPNGHNLQYFETSLAAVDSSASLSQEVSIPTGMNKPTLSFMTQINGGEPLPTTSFDVVIVDDAIETTIFSENSDHLWQHHWVSMDDYLGKTVTIKFVINQKAGEPIVHVDLDDVSLSGWNALTIIDVSPSTVLGETTPITVTGTNFATTATVYLDGQLLDPALVLWVNDQTLVFNLPVGLLPGVYNLMVENPGGIQDTLLNALIVGNPIFLPCIGAD
jgi:Tol biopolymer transport system component